jgi:hypothetical protein
MGFRRGESAMSTAQKHGIITLCRVVSVVGRVMLSVISLPTESHALVVTESERAACTPDVLRLCGSEIPNVDRVISCMRAKRSKLSSPCKLVVEKHMVQRSD